MIMTDKLERIWKEAIVTCLSTVSGAIEQDHETYPCNRAAILSWDLQYTKLKC
jgi:hypothetical protein